MKQYMYTEQYCQLSAESVSLGYILNSRSLRQIQTKKIISIVTFSSLHHEFLWLVRFFIAQNTVNSTQFLIEVYYIVVFFLH